MPFGRRMGFLKPWKTQGQPLNGYRPRYPGRRLGWWAEPLVEPFDPAPHDVTTVFRPAHRVALARVNDQLRRHLQRLQGVAKLLRLRQGALQVALTDQH